MESILDPGSIDTLFTENSSNTEQNPPSEEDGTKENKTTEVAVNPEELFGDSPKEETNKQPESVGSGDNKETQEQEASSSVETKDPPSKPNLYSSITGALKEDGVFPELDQEEISKIQTPEDFAKAMQKVVEARLDETNKRINEALTVGVNPTQIQQYEGTINYLNSLQDTDISDEGDKGSEVRKRLIFQDYINKGFTEERATREVNRSFSSGEDIQDAKDAKESLKSSYIKEYQDIINSQKSSEEEAIKTRDKEILDLKKSMVEDKEVFTGVEIDPITRKKAFDSVTKPVFKDEKGNLYTAVQKYQIENPTEFRKKLGVLYAMTDGFKDINKLIAGGVKKGYNSKLRELQHTLTNMPANPDGTYNLVGVGQDDKESNSSEWKLDV